MMEKYLEQVPPNIKTVILGLAASNGLSANDYNNNALVCFVEGAVAMYHYQQRIIQKLCVDIDLLEGELYKK